MRSQEVDRGLFQAGWIIELVHFSDELGVVILEFKMVQSQAYGGAIQLASASRKQ